MKTQADVILKRTASGAFVLLSDPAVKLKLEQDRASIASDRKQALKLLVAAGITTRTGKLSKKFGG